MSLRHIQNNVAHLLMFLFIVYSCVVGWSVYNTIISALLIMVSLYRQHLEAHTQKSELQDRIKALEFNVSSNSINLAKAIEDLRKNQEDIKNNVSKYTINDLKKNPMSQGYKF